MKKIIMMLAIIISTTVAFASGEDVNKKVLEAFKTEFSSATDVEWSVGQDYYRAKFNYNEKYVFAYFNENGELLGLSQFLSPTNLPINLQTSLNKKYKNYWISDLFEVAKKDSTTYYITLENADTKLMLRSDEANSWSVYNTIQKS